MRFLLLFFPLQCLASSLTFELESTRLTALQNLVHNQHENKEAAEMHYQEQIQRETFRSLIEVYRPENQSGVQMTYASFTPDSEEGGGEDLGFGLHIVKRLTLKLPNGKTKVIDINELWPEDRKTNGIFLPDEIRIKMQVVDGERFVPGSEKLYLFDSFRIAWGPTPDQIEFARRTRFEFHEGKNRMKEMRVPVSAPLSCKGCHRPQSTLSNVFLQPGEKRNYEAIVQDSQFKLPPNEMRGFKQYVEYLKKIGKNEGFIKTVEEKLYSIRSASSLPTLIDALQNALKKNEMNWLTEDQPFLGDSYFRNIRQGVYKNSTNGFNIDPLEEIIEGKYRWWEPTVAIP